MARSGGGGGGHRGGGSVHHGGSSRRGGSVGFHTASARTSSSSSSGYRSSGYRSSGPTHYNNGPRYYGNTNRTYGGSGAGCGCVDGVVVMFIVAVLLICVIITSCMGGFGGSSDLNRATVSDEVVINDAERFYNKTFGNREDVFLFYIAYSKTVDDELQYVYCGGDVNDSIGEYRDEIIDYYADNLDLNDSSIEYGKVISYTLRDFMDGSLRRVEKIDGKFNKKDSHVDQLGWIDNEKKIESAAEEFYELTGAQFCVVIADYDKGPNKTTKNTTSYTALVVFGIGIVVLVIIIISYNWWKKKKAQKNKEAEDAIKILNTPLESFGDIDNLAKKYDDPDGASGSSTSSTNDSVYFGSNDDNNSSDNNI